MIKTGNVTLRDPAPDGRDFLVKSLEDKCGILGIHTLKPSINFPLALLAATGLQHRGQHGAGVSMQTAKGLLHHTGSGLLKEAINKTTVETFNQESFWTMVHLRYGTSGDYHACNLQPIIGTSENGEKIAVIHNGEFVATDELKKKLKNIDIPEGASDTYLFTHLLAQTPGANWDEKIVNTLKQVKGAYSLILGVNNCLYAIRDPWGIRPLVLGKIDGGWIFASETHAFNKINAQIVRELKKGEIVRVDEQGLTILQEGSTKPGNFCDFEWAYFSRPNSQAPTHEDPQDRDQPEKWLSKSRFRKRCGVVIARETPIKNASFVVGVPDSGVAVATGYAKEAKIPYAQLILRDHFDPNGMHRLFMRDDQIKSIGKKVLGKLSLVPDSSIWKNAIVVIGDDSIVRGNVSQRLTEAIFKLGAKEVHWIVGFPPVAYPCHLGVSMRTKEELIAHRFNSDPKKIAAEIGATSVNYISPHGFIWARKLSTDVTIPENPKEIFLANGGCSGCITGLYPVSKNGEIYPRFTA